MFKKNFIEFLNRYFLYFDNEIFSPLSVFKGYRNLLKKKNYILLLVDVIITFLH